MANNDIKIYGAVRAMTGDGIAAYAEQIYDSESEKYLPELLEEAGGGTAESTSYDNTESGLSATNVQDAIDELSNQGGGGVNQAQIGYFVCDTAAATAAKTISATGYALATGGNIRIKMTNANTANAVTLNINNTGAKALFYNGAQASSTNSWEAGEVVEVYYDGTNYQASNSYTDINELTYTQLEVAWTKGYFVNGSNVLVANNSYWAAQNVDITGYDKILACVTAQSSAKIVILDENQTVLAAKNGTNLTIDLSTYPTAKYMSFSNGDAKSSMQIWGTKSSHKSLQESSAEYAAGIGNRSSIYPIINGEKIFIYPAIKKGYYLTTANKLFPNGNSQYSDYISIPKNATKIYYTGRALSAAAAVVFYDSYKNFLSYVTNASNVDYTDVEISIPANAVYARVSSMNSLLAFHFDKMPDVIISGSNKATIYEKVAATWTDGGYINSSNTVVSDSSCSYIQNLDISEYAGKKIRVYTDSFVSAARNLLTDIDGNILYSVQGGLNLDLADFPTAKYLSLTRYYNRTTGDIYVENESSLTISEIVSKYYMAFGDFGAEYANEIVNNYYIEPEADMNGYYLGQNNNLVAQAGAKYSTRYYLIPPVATKVYYTGVSFGNAKGILFFNKDKTLISAVAVGSDNTPISNVEVTIPSGAVYLRISSYTSSCVLTYDKPTIKVGGGGSTSVDLSNYLYGKKYVALGDSFTDSIGTEVIDVGPLAGFSKVYPYIIANRNNMNVLNQGASGTVLGGYIAQSRYNNIPADVDYITIWYGINDAAHGIEIGTVSDQPETITTATGATTCGAFNWFFKWVLTNRPYAKIGCIITDYSTEERRHAIIDCCKKWGIAYLDLMGDPTIPMFPAGRDSDIQVASEAITLRANAFNINGTANIHPSNKMHEWQSTIIENFMRGL